VLAASHLTNPQHPCCPLLLRPPATAHLYHFDHWLGAFTTVCGALVDCQHYELLPGPPPHAQPPAVPGPPDPGVVAVYVAVTDSAGKPGGVFELRMVQRAAGMKAGSWMTKSCRRVKEG
jgi:hypothetical protein